MAEHDSITDPDIHEPKGASTAPAGAVYIADGAGSGSWGTVGSAFQHDYGMLYSVDSDAISISGIGTTAKKLEAFAHAGPFSGMTLDPTNNQITVGDTGAYYINFSATIKTTAVGDAGQYEFYIRVNDVQTVLGVERQMSGSSDTGSLAVSGILNVPAAGVISIWVESDEAGNTDDIDVLHCYLTAQAFGIE